MTQRARLAGIRVMNVSLGVTAWESYLIDPLARAVRGATARASSSKSSHPRPAKLPCLRAEGVLTCCPQPARSAEPELAQVQTLPAIHCAA